MLSDRLPKLLLLALPGVLEAAGVSEEAPVCDAAGNGECAAAPADVAGESAEVESLKVSLLQARTQQAIRQHENFQDAQNVTNDEPCLCSFDIDRTLTGKQSKTHECPESKVVHNVRDTAYGGGTLTLSPVGQTIKGTFCERCYVGIVTAGDASGHNSPERARLVLDLKASGAKLISEDYSGPSLYGENRRPCQAHYATTPLVVGCTDGSKQEAVKGIAQLIQRREGVVLKPENVHHYDDRSQNIYSFKGTGYNAHQVSCSTRDGHVGLCGAQRYEITDAKGINACQSNCASFGCKDTYIHGRSCQCNSECAKYNSCCSDYEAVCKKAPAEVPAAPAEPTPLTPAEEGDDEDHDTSASGKAQKPCLCLFDVDRTLTGKQGDTHRCSKNRRDPSNIRDTAYGGGSLTLSEAGQDLHSTFCEQRKCYVGIVTAGDASGEDSRERHELVSRLKNSGGKLINEEWCGPSKHGEHRLNCRADKVTCGLVTGCNDGTKQEAAKGILRWIKETEGVTVAPEEVWHFDDRADNVQPFRGTGMNARQISCGHRAGVIGHCGAEKSELVGETGVHVC
eukprot:TRINITY_DN12219_c0_g1_i1.p1 TRINITY_DN12219_c0_g1~~TRINITY_DN12219_c0_g1_i1.p1  ORF type:complete len:567 (+),score=125.31 TRINITY_DN12219_c0_g1_i1:109-1809(+)